MVLSLIAGLDSMVYLGTHHRLPNTELSSIDRAMAPRHSLLRSMILSADWSKAPTVNQ